VLICGSHGLDVVSCPEANPFKLAYGDVAAARSAQQLSDGEPDNDRRGNEGNHRQERPLAASDREKCGCEPEDANEECDSVERSVGLSPRSLAGNPEQHGNG